MNPEKVTFPVSSFSFRAASFGTTSSLATSLTTTCSGFFTTSGIFFSFFRAFTGSLTSPTSSGAHDTTTPISRLTQIKFFISGQNLPHPSLILS